MKPVDSLAMKNNNNNASGRKTSSDLSIDDVMSKNGIPSPAQTNTMEPLRAADTSDCNTIQNVSTNVVSDESLEQPVPDAIDIALDATSNSDRSTSEINAMELSSSLTPIPALALVRELDSEHSDNGKN